MRLPFPERIPLRYAVYFAVLLSIVQLAQGTDANFSICSFLFIVVATITFNLAGGLTRASGGYVFFYSVLAVILGLVWKAVLGEPADSNLTRPLLTIQASLGTIVAMLGAVFISRKLMTKRAILGNMMKDTNILQASVGCMIFGLALSVILAVVGFQSGTVLSSLNQLNQFLPLAIILGVIAQIRRSGGTSSVNLPVLVSGAILFAGGVINFAKQGMFLPLLCWLIAAASQRYRITFYKGLGFILAMAFIAYYLVPYSQYGRNFRPESFTENVDISVSLLSNLGYVRQQYEQSAEHSIEEGSHSYFDTPQGIFDRLQMISPDDALISVTEENGKIGFAPIVLEFENLIPHVFWPGKPAFGIGNLYAHEIGMIADEDTSTGISFSPTAEAFHTERWLGIFVLAPALWIMLFTIFDSLCGDARKQPWGLLAIVLFAHAAPESMLGGVIYMMWYGAAGIVFAALTTAYLMPVVGALFMGSERTGLRRAAPVHSVPRRLPRIQPSRNTGQ